MTENISYKDGYKEGVAFCFYKDGKVLLEDRGRGFNNEAFFPSGTIELKDKIDGNYIEVALLREIKEEFQGQIIVNSHVYLGEIKVDAIGVIFYLYLITDYHGSFPDVIKEEGELDSTIRFFTLNECKKLFKYDSAFEMLNLVTNNIENI